MIVLPKPTPFDQAAVDHFLDSTRDRDVRVELVPPYSKMDMPTLRMTIPMLGAGDHRGLEALCLQMAAGDYLELSVRFEGQVFPCGVMSAGPFGEPEAVLELRVLGPPISD